MSEDRTPSLTPRCRGVLVGATAIARGMGHPYVGVEHLFLAIIGDPRAVPTQVLARAADVAQIEATLRAVMRSPGYHGEPPPGAIWFPAAELPRLLAVLPHCVAPGVDWGFNVVSDQAWIVVGDPGDTGHAAAALATARDLIAREQTTGDQG